MTGDNPCDAGLELYRRFQGGDETAFDELVLLYRGSLTDYICGFVGDRREAEELAIDAFAELAADTKYKGLSSLKTYLFSIGRHLALRHVKQYISTDHIPIDEIINELGAGENPLEADYLCAERSERLHAAMRALKPEHQEALRLVYFEDMSYADTAKTMRKTEKQIRNLLYTAKSTLKKILDDEGAGA
jgi:RNA polymerase sigma-70 factor (ECF subfamily)